MDDERWYLANIIFFLVPLRRGLQEARVVDRVPPEEERSMMLDSWIGIVSLSFDNDYDPQ